MSYSFTPYDDAWRTLINDARVTLIPLINEMFKEKGIHFTGNEKIKFSNNGIYLNQQDGDQDKKITDSTFTVSNGSDVRRFHIECQSTTDGSMIIRMFEYDSQIALNDARNSWTKGDLYVKFPESGILYLRSTINTPDYVTITIEVPSGEKVSYKIPALKISDYSVEDISNKDLFLLIPFYVFKFEKFFPQMDKPENGIMEKLISELNVLCTTLNAALSDGKLKEQDIMVISDMFKKVIRNLMEDHEIARKELMKSMGGTILDYPTKTAYKLGDKLGTARQLVRSVKKNMDKYHVSLEDACDGCGSTVEEYEAAQDLLNNEESLNY